MDSRDVGRMFDRDLAAETDRYLNQDKPATYYGLSTKGVWAALCSLGEIIARSEELPKHGASCNNLGCVCTSEDIAFRPTTEEEDAQFWEAMSALTNQALYEQEHDL
jgi:hypothetical protein